MNLRFLQPDLLWFMIVPATFLLIWARLFWKRIKTVGLYENNRIVPVKEKFLLFGKLAGWALLILVMTLGLLALSRPQARISITNEQSVDLVLIMDGSASFRVKDVTPDRWQRSTRWIGNLIKNMSWRGDRLALAAFAYRASPFVRFTKDPNVILFFLDYLGKEPPFRLEEDTTWHSNVAEGIRWGFRLIEKDGELFGKSKNPQAMVVISDGQELTGELEQSIQKAKEAGIKIHVIGVGTTFGGVIPEHNPIEPTRSAIDRTSLHRIKDLGGGEYFELGIQSDDFISSSIIRLVQNQNLKNASKQEVWEGLYWWCLVAGAILLSPALYFLFRN